jgi:DNA end-binding protein Ku
MPSGRANRFGPSILKGQMRTTWNGSISFGLVSIPVGLAPATKPAARASDVSFRMLHRECGTPIKQKRFCPVHERDLGPDEIVKGWEVAKGQFVIVEDEEIEALTNRDDSRSIEISRFVDAAQVDPIFFDRTYFLVPAQAPAARRPYVLLLNAMNESGMAALGRFVQQGKEKLCLIRPKGDALALETLFLAADVYSQAEIEEAVEETSVKKPELALAQQVIDSLAGDFDPSELQSDYRRDLKALLEAKLAGQEIATAPEPEEEVPVVDLMEALRRSVEEAKSAKQAGNGAAKEKAAPKKASARSRKTAAR